MLFHWNLIFIFIWIVLFGLILLSLDLFQFLLWENSDWNFLDCNDFKVILLDEARETNFVPEACINISLLLLIECLLLVLLIPSLSPFTLIKFVPNMFCSRTWLLLYLDMLNTYWGLRIVTFIFLNVETDTGLSDIDIFDL